MLLVARLAADRTRRAFLVEDLARLGRKSLADVLALGEQVVEHARVQHLRDGKRVFAFHFRRLGGLRGRLWLRLGRAQIGPGGGRHARYPRGAAGRTREQLAIALGSEILGRAEPALEPVPGAAKQIENNHLSDSTMPP